MMELKESLAHDNLKTLHIKMQIGQAEVHFYIKRFKQIKRSVVCVQCIELTYSIAKSQCKIGIWSTFKTRMLLPASSFVVKVTEQYLS